MVFLCSSAFYLVKGRIDGFASACVKILLFGYRCLGEGGEADIAIHWFLFFYESNHGEKETDVRCTMDIDSILLRSKFNF